MMGISFTSCEKEDLTKSLNDTAWEGRYEGMKCVFEFKKTTVDITVFVSSPSDMVGGVQTLKYTYNHPSITITKDNEILFLGTVFENRITMREGTHGSDFYLDRR